MKIKSTETLKAELRDINLRIEHCYDHFEFRQLKARKEEIEQLLSTTNDK